MATDKQKNELVRLTRNYTNAQSNGNQKAVTQVAKDIKTLKEKMK